MGFTTKLLILALNFALVAQAEVGGWSFAHGCPESGSASPSAIFSANSIGGFSSSGRCQRTSSRFTKFHFTSVTGGTVNASTVYGHHTGDVLVVPPILNSETKPVFLADAKCPVRNKGLNWLFSQWESTRRNVLNNYPTVGSASYNPSSGISLNTLYDVDGSLLYSGAIALPGDPCTNGIVTLNGTGDRGGSVVFTQNGSGHFKADSGKSTLFVPVYTVDPAVDFGGITFKGMVFNSAVASASRTVRVVADADGTTWSVSFYSDPETETIDSSYSDSVSMVGGVNYPSDGILMGTVTRTGVGAGTGHIACVVAKAIGTRINCTGESPNDNTIPYSLVFSIEGMQVTGQASGKSASSLELGLFYPGDFSSDGTRAFAADINNSRVLIWNSVPTTFQAPPDLVLGQADLASNVANSGGRSAQTMYRPQRVRSDGTRLFVADTANNRVLIWNSMPTESGTAADVVLGQPDMTSGAANNGGVSAQSLSSPMSVSVSGSRLVVTDYGNSRILIWNSIPTSNFASADVVVGQPNMSSSTGNNGGVSASSLYYPTDAYFGGNELVVADTYNNRVMIWDSLPIIDGAAASRVLGQSAMTSNSVGVASAQTLSSPYSVFVYGTTLSVADLGNSRILIWNAMPSANNQAADLVLGQPDMATGSQNSGGISAQTLYYPRSVFQNATRLFVADGHNHRLLLWNPTPTVSQAAATVVLGQNTMTSGLSYGGASDKSLTAPKTVTFANGKMFVVDHGNSRVLIWNTIPKLNMTAADVVVGQPGMNSSASWGVTTSARTLMYPQSAASDGVRLVVADTNNHRVLIWNSIPTTNYAPADVVLGQPDMASNGSLAVSAQTLSYPMAVFIEGTRLFVADGNNRRILIWNTIPTVNQTPADVVVGQTNMTDTFSIPGIGPSNLNNPGSIFVKDGKMFVADRGNSRVLIWNAIPTTNGVAADLVLGKPNFSDTQINFTTATSEAVHTPSAVFWDGTHLFVSDYNDNRVLVWNGIPTSNGAAANMVMGQPNFSSRIPNNGGRSSTSLAYPGGIYSDGKILYVADDLNHRVLSLEIP